MLIPWVKMKQRGQAAILESGGDPYAGIRMGMGVYIRHCTEFILFSVRGKAPTARKDALGVVFAPRGKHSEKPQEAYDLIDSLSPSPRLELFARRPRPGYQVWGDEIAAIP